MQENNVLNTNFMRLYGCYRSTPLNVWCVMGLKFTPYIFLWLLYKCLLLLFLSILNVQHLKLNILSLIFVSHRGRRNHRGRRKLYAFQAISFFSLLKLQHLVFLLYSQIMILISLKKKTPLLLLNFPTQVKTILFSQVHRPESLRSGLTHFYC